METKHTKGPWYPKMYRGAFEDDRPTWGVRNAMFSICNLVEQDMEDVENGEECATAHLIAAAPELLGELKELLAEYIHETEIVKGDEGVLGAQTLEVQFNSVIEKARAAIAKATPPSAPEGEE